MISARRRCLEDVCKGCTHNDLSPDRACPSRAHSLTQTRSTPQMPQMDTPSCSFSNFKKSQASHTPSGMFVPVCITALFHLQACGLKFCLKLSLTFWRFAFAWGITVSNGISTFFVCRMQTSSRGHRPTPPLQRQKRDRDRESCNHPLTQLTCWSPFQAARSPLLRQRVSRDMLACCMPGSN